MHTMNVSEFIQFVRLATELKNLALDRKHDELPEQINSSLAAFPAMAITLAESMQLDATLAAASDFSARLARTDLPNMSFEEVTQRLDMMLKTLEAQTTGRLLMYTDGAKTLYWNNDKPFGDEVAKKFPELAFEIEEASKCFAVGRFTACVFHLMRVMEMSLARVGRLLKLKLDLDQVWGAILKDIRSAIEALPGKAKSASARDQKRYATFAELGIYLQHVKDVWRNNTMHPKNTYTEEEAERIFRCVRQFLESLAKLR
ncbi:MAG: hypothetical protein U0793_03365 [Gemmataceae bacterium]